MRNILLFILIILYHNILYSKDLLPLTELNNVKPIKSSKNLKSAIDIPAEIYSITDRDIERSGLTSIPEILRLAPGLHVTQMNSNSWSISSRGFNADLNEKLVVMIDGRKVHATLFPSIFWENQDLIISDIKRIDIIRGTGANIIQNQGLDRHIWSDNALHGVINIVTKRAAETQGKHISILHGNQESIKSVKYGGEIKKDILYRLYAKHRMIDSELDVNNENAKNNWQDQRSGFRIDWENSLYNQLTLQGDIGKMKDKAKYIHPSSDLTTYIDRILKDESRSGNIMIKWLHRKDSGNELTLRSYYDYYERKWELFQQKFDIIDLDLQYSLTEKSYGQFMFGLSYRINNSKINYQPQYEFKYKEYSNGLFNSFIQNKIDIIPKKLSLTTSLKLQYEEDLMHKEYSNLSLHPNLRMNIKLTDRQSIWAATSKITRNPTIAERSGTMVRKIRDTSPYIVTLNGNDNFKQEELISYEFGYRNHLSEKLFVDISSFFNKYDNLRSYELGPITSSRIQYNLANNLYGESFGAEISSKIAINNNLDLSINYSWMKMHLHKRYGSTDTESESDENSSPQNQFSIRSYYNLSHNLQWNNLLFYVGKLKKYNIDAYFKFDSNLIWKINDNLKFTLAGQNLFNNRRQEFIPFIYHEENFIEANKIYAKINISF